jgi:hypothetical protein
MAAALVCLGAAVSSAQQPPADLSSDLDVLMKAALAHREDNRLLLQQYILDEAERFRVEGPGRTPLYGRDRQFAWYIRDGIHVRSPVRADGVPVPADAREAYEQEWMHQERARLARRDQRDGRAAPRPAVPDDPAPGASNLPIAAPRFVSEAYFLDFKFEPGNYFLAGRETLEGRQVLRIEYYPEQMFSGDPDRDAEPEERRAQRSDKEREQEDAVRRNLNKTALITLWVDPAERQIVKYTFDNVWMDFLPGAWLARVDDVHTSMTMGQPFPGVWLPRGLEVDASFSLASGTFGVRYDRAFSNYRLAETKSTIRVPKAARARRPSGVLTEARPTRAWTIVPSAFVLPAAVLAFAGGWAAAAAPPAQAASPEIVREVRVHGNVTVPDDEVLRLAGITLGQPLDDRTIEDITVRLDRSGVFDSIEVRKRFRSLEASPDVTLILLVHEKAGVAVTPDGQVRTPSPVRRLTSRLQFLPILGYEDGYGWTYGGRVSTTGLLGAGEHLSVPLSWGGTRRAVLEARRDFRRGPLSSISASTGIVQRENPRFGLDDQRAGVWGRAERRLAGGLAVGASGGSERVRFGGARDSLATVGADVTLDTRRSPSFPRNAVLARAGWTGLSFGDIPGVIDRVDLGARGYAGVVGQLVFAGRVDYTGANAALPPSERLLLGGWASLRGTRAGALDGDRRLLASAEVRLPLTSVLSGSKLGVLAFYDRGTVWDTGARLAEASWRSGAGGGVFIIAPFVTLTLDVAHGFPDGDTRVHFGTGFSF